MLVEAIGATVLTLSAPRERLFVDPAPWSQLVGLVEPTVRIVAASAFFAARAPRGVVAMLSRASAARRANEGLLR
mgnify:CR=1 FL=1